MDTVPEGLKLRHPDGLQRCKVALFLCCSRSPLPVFMPDHSAATGNGILIFRERPESDFCVVLISCRKNKEAKIILHHFRESFFKLQVLHYSTKEDPLFAKVVSSGGQI